MLCSPPHLAYVVKTIRGTVVNHQGYIKYFFLGPLRSGSVDPSLLFARLSPPFFCRSYFGSQQQELCNMMIECCSQERTWLPYYGLIAQRFCMLHRRWQGAFTECFETNYNTIHRSVRLAALRPCRRSGDAACGPQQSVDRKMMIVLVT